MFKRVGAAQGEKPRVGVWGAVDVVWKMINMSFVVVGSKFDVWIVESGSRHQ